MRDGEEVKIVFTGPMGAGKTTAIAAISDAPPVSTDVFNADRQSADKDTTTAALDFGQIVLDDGLVVRLYGTPGQDRFDFMWRILGRGALGVVLLLDASRVTALTELDAYLDSFADQARSGCLVIGLGRTGSPGAIDAADVLRRLRVDRLALPVFSVDVRRREDVMLLMEALLSLIEVAPQQEEAH
ncbi:MAG: ATP/GTP-binding protein [Xanthomonadales bacterium]|nr:ATP/GTP-binding protein [Xanthomonadales bacterium]